MSNELIHDCAIQWIVSLRSENITEETQDEFFNWFFDSMEHQVAFAEILELWEKAAEIKNLKLNDLNPDTHVLQFNGSFG